MNGTLNDIKPMDDSILPCRANGEDIVKFQSFGLLLFKTCLNYYTKSNEYYYDMYVIDS